ncbi:MAG: NAD(P)/FAD-dependent oxidoreductase [Porticoccaceae bacterium]|jgi:NADH dehydrogenase|nr:NAD(P)/FAD-dependent oxidoreductase [Porticoccaceae bacterium]MEA3301067.1 NAD(P)/FAD-dependent oxidoreductase [Pseudomonadota bacterium]
MNAPALPRILIVGGGAGGLPLATRLGKRLGKTGRAEITLVDSNNIHVWKPRFHEVATGSIDSDLDALDYRGHARANHYDFEPGTLAGVDRERREILLAPLLDGEGREILPERRLAYDQLVLAIGSQGNDFNIPGVRQHCLFLDTREQADRFHDRFLNVCLAANHADRPVSIAIVGAGATGVELAAELHHAVAMLHRYGHRQLSRKRLNVHLIEAGPRILPALNERVSVAAHGRLEEMGVSVHTATQVTEARANAFVTGDGREIGADLLVWAAGIKAPALLATLGLETNRINQLVVTPSLQTTTDGRIWVIGDCASYTPEPGGRPIPPRAQSAQQMASQTAINIARVLKGEAPQPFVYQDRGSLVSLSKFSSIGTLMGNLKGGQWFIEGWLARSMYISLYRLHQAALYGWPRTLLLLAAGRFNRLVRPRLKLH